MYNYKDTIVAPATGPDGALSIIRASGSNVFEICKKIFIPSKAFENPLPNNAYFLKIIDENKNVIDRVVVLIYIAPKSFTGENMVEIFAHNSPFIVKKIIELFIKNGAKSATKGEFSFRAYINGKIDLVQAEAINELIKAETEKQHLIAINQLEGKLSKKLNLIKQQIIEILAEVEVRIDDSYEEVEKLDKEKYIKKLDSIIDEINKLKETYHSAKYIKTGIKVSIVGVPNSGKSSLLNKILGYERAIISEIPGTTRDTIEESVVFEGIKFIFTDTAGIRTNTNDRLEEEGIKRTINSIKKADIIIFLKDISTKETEDENLIYQKIIQNKKLDARLIEVYSKSDLKPQRKIDDRILKVSSKTGENIDKLIEILCDIKEKITDEIYDEIMVSERHYKCLCECVNELIQIKSIDIENYEIVAEHLRASLCNLEEILGKTTPEDILKTIFSNFCVGK
jgi:tRNA modification GTPase